MALARLPHARAAGGARRLRPGAARAGPALGARRAGLGGRGDRGGALCSAAPLFFALPRLHGPLRHRAVPHGRRLRDDADGGPRGPRVLRRGQAQRPRRAAASSSSDAPRSRRVSRLREAVFTEYQRRKLAARVPARGRGRCDRRWRPRAPPPDGGRAARVVGRDLNLFGQGLPLPALRLVRPCDVERAARGELPDGVLQVAVGPRARALRGGRRAAAAPRGPGRSSDRSAADVPRGDPRVRDQADGRPVATRGRSTGRIEEPPPQGLRLHARPAEGPAATRSCTSCCARRRGTASTSRRRRR